MWSRSQRYFSGHISTSLLIIVLFCLALRLIFFAGMGTSDPLWYSKAAANIGQGIDQDNIATLSTRIGLTYPVGFIYKILGVNDFSSALFNLITSIGSIILMFYFGKLFFNEKVGLLSAFLFAIFPLEIVYATKLTSDFPAAFFMGLGLYFFLYQEIKAEKKQWPYYFLSGIMIGVGYLIRESMLVIALFFIAYMIYKRKIAKEYFLVPIGVLLILVLEMAFFFSLTGDPLYRTHASQEILKESMEQHDYYGRLDFPQGLFHYPWLFLTDHTLTFFYMFVLLSIAYCLWKRKKETYILLLWFIPMLLYISFGSGSLTSYVPIRAVDRYTSIFNMPALLLLAFFLLDLKERMRKWIVPSVLGFLLISSITVVVFREDRNQLDLLREAHPYLESVNKATYIDRRSSIALSYLSEYEGNPLLQRYPDSLEGIHDAYVAVNHEMISKLRAAGDEIIFPKEIDAIPKNWKLEKSIGNAPKYIEIYYVP